MCALSRRQEAAPHLAVAVLSHVYRKKNDKITLPCGLTCLLFHASSFVSTFEGAQGPDTATEKRHGGVSGLASEHGIVLDVRHLKAIDVCLDHITALGIKVKGMIETRQRLVQSPELFEHLAHLHVHGGLPRCQLLQRQELLKRSVNDGFSGGEKKRNEIFQMAMLEPRLAILDETDSGLDIDALRVVSEGVQALRGPERSMLVITHYQRLLDHIVPDRVHVLANGRIVKSGDRDLALRLEKEGYAGLLSESVSAGSAPVSG